MGVIAHGVLVESTGMSVATEPVDMSS